MAVVVMLNSTEQQTWAGVMGWLGSVVVIPMVVALLISASGRIRAVAPYLLPIFLVLSAASTGALSLLAAGVQDPPVWIVQLVGVLGAWPAIVLLALLPWLLLAWPVWRLGLWLAQAYRDKRFSDLGYLLAAYWFVILVASALPAVEGAGWLGFTQLLPWLWLPLLAKLLPRWLALDTCAVADALDSLKLPAAVSGLLPLAGVRREWRKRGLGYAMLKHAFAAFYADGKKRAGLGVDASSLTGALRLYERAGMRVQRQFNQFEKDFRPGRELAVMSLETETTEA
jgi:GNAT superfamily N-acetyltransferase